jgi:AcrR family transcriptional regulator
MRDGAKTRARIEAEALRLFAGKGIDATSVRDIAAAAGVAEGALYRHFPSKEALARTLFLEGYADLAARVVEAGSGARPIADIVRDVVGLFCTLFDENRPLFSVLLLTQHAHLGAAPARPERNVVEAVRQIFAAAIDRGELPAQDADQLTAVALGMVAQPAIFTIYGRLQGPLKHRAAALSAAVLAAARCAA